MGWLDYDSTNHNCNERQEQVSCETSCEGLASLRYWILERSGPDRVALQRSVTNPMIKAQVSKIKARVSNVISCHPEEDMTCSTVVGH